MHTRTTPIQAARQPFFLGGGGELGYRTMYTASLLILDTWYTDTRSLYLYRSTVWETANECILAACRGYERENLGNPSYQESARWH